MVTFALRNWTEPEAQHCLPEPMAWSPGGDKSLSLESPGPVFVIHPGQSRWSGMLPLLSVHDGQGLMLPCFIQLLCVTA